MTCKTTMSQTTLHHWGNSFKLQLDSLRDDDSAFHFYYHGICKNFFESTIKQEKFLPAINFFPTPHVSPTVIDARPKTLIKGQVVYEYYFNNRIDTPFAAQNLQQH